MPPLPVPTDAELEELAKTLETSEIPSKLRCGICDLLAYETMRLPCCSTNICHKCYENELTDECIICCHKPFDQSLCEPNKVMRITIKALLKREHTKRAKKQADAAKTQDKGTPKPETVVVETEPTSVQHVITPTEQETTVSVQLAVDSNTAHERNHVLGSTMSEVDGHARAEALSLSLRELAATVPEVEAEVISENARPTSKGDPETTATINANFNQANGMNQMNGMFPVDYSMMNNGMMPGMPSMMGMGMMPAMMSSMFGGFDNMNMGMNGMNMGMGFNQGMNNGGAWMNNQGNFNNAYGNAGYNMSGPQSNYNHMMNEQSYANNHEFQRGYGRGGFQRGRGRRGYYNGPGYGRGGFNQMNQGNYQHGGYANQGNQEQLYPQQQEQQQNNDTDQPANEAPPMSKEQEEALMASFAPGGEHDFDEELGRTPLETPNEKTEEPTLDTSVSSGSKDTAPTELFDSAPAQASNESDSKDVEIITEIQDEAYKLLVVDQEPRPIQSFVPDEPQSQYANNSAPRSDYAVASIQAPRPQSNTANFTPTIEPRGLGVVGAPTGPKALRAGFSNAGNAGFRPGNGFRPQRNGSVDVPSQSVKSPSLVQEDSLAAKSRSVSRSPDRDDHNRHRSRHHEYTEELASRAEKGDHKRAHRRHEQSRDEETYYEEDRETSKSSRHKHDEYAEDEDGSRRSRHKSRRHREEEHGTEEHRRSSKRSHHEHEDDHAEDEKHRRSSKRSRRHHEEEADSSSRRSRRDRSRSPGHDKHRSSGKERHRHREEDRGYAEEKSSRTNSHVPTPTSANAPAWPEPQLERTSRKRRSQDFEAPEQEVDEYEQRKRARHDRFSKSGEGISIRGASKPNTPTTAGFPPTGSASRRGSNVINGSFPPARPVPTGPRGASGHGGSNKHQPAENEPGSQEAKKPEKDPHTLEREARDRERLQREMQRRAFSDVPGMKKKGGTANGSNGRRINYKFEGDNTQDARRTEKERETVRWH